MSKDWSGIDGIAERLRNETLSLANVKRETWVADRTGHASSQMINRYRRAARSAQELELGELLPLDQAIEWESHFPTDSGPRQT